MSLIFQPRPDGFRVVREGPVELMLASVVTKTMCTETSAVSPKNQNGATHYRGLPKDDCSIHSAIGALSIGDLEAIIHGIEYPEVGAVYTAEGEKL